MKTKKSTSLRNFVTAIVLAAALLAAGALWVLLGWRGALDVTLTDLAGDPAAPVSYTHLDVYKRQYLYRAAHRGRLVFLPKMCATEKHSFAQHRIVRE